MKFFWLVALLFASSAQAYTGQELRGDCQAADEMYAGQKSSDPFQAIRSARCIAYVAGFADSYAVTDYLTEHVERVPPNTTVSPATLVAGAFAKSFPCSDSLEPKK